MSDRVLGGVGLALAIFYAWAASIIPESFAMDAIGAKTFPTIIAAVLGLCSVYFLLKPDPEPVWPGFDRIAEIGFAVLVFVGYAVALPSAGFLIATAVAAGYLSWRLGTKPPWAIVVGLATSVGIYVVFRMVLGLSLARGPFGF